MPKAIKKWFPKRVRLAIYAVAIAALPIGVHYGLLEPEMLPLAAPFLLALLNLSDDDVSDVAPEV